MRVRKRSILFVVAMYAVVGLIGTLSPLLSTPAAAEADKSQFAFDYNPDPSNVTAMSKAAAVPQDNSAFGNSEVYAQGGLFGSGAEFTYQRLVTGSAQTSGSYQYSYDYTCVGGTPQTGAAPTNVDSYTVEVSVFMSLGANFYSQPAVLSGNYYLTHVTFTGAQVPNQPIATHTDAHNVGGIPENDSNLKAMGFPDSCISDVPPFVYGNRTSADKNKWIPNLEAASAAVKAAWQPVISAAVTAGPGGVGPPGSGSSSSSDTNECGSVSFGLGWFLCPIIELANNTIGALFQDVVISSLKTEPLNANDGGYGQSLYTVWSNVRSVADVGFALIFLVIIFANLLGFEIDAYAIKTMIPKLVAAAVLVQFSFVLSAALLDLGNVLGQGVASLLYQVAGHGTGLGGGEVFDNIIGAILATLFAIVAISTVGALLVVPILIVGIAAILGTLAVVFTLIVRKIIIALVVVFSPLAFVAFVLPGTEKFFRIWLQNFIRVVMMFPMIAALFAMSAVLASVTSHTSGDSASVLNVQQMIAAAFPIICFFLVPMTFRWAGGVMNMAYGEFNKISSRASGRAGKAINESEGVKTLRALRASNKRAKRADADTSGGFRGYVAGVQSRGDVFGKNRQFKLQRNKNAKGFRKFVPTPGLPKDASMQRAQIRQQNQRREEDLGARMEVDENVLKGLQSGVLKSPEAIGKAPGGRGQIENAIVAMAAQNKKYKFLDANALPSLHRAMKSAGMSDEEIYRANDFIVGQDYARYSASNPAAAMTRLPGKEYIDTTPVPKFKRDDKTSKYVRDASGQRVQQGTRQTKLVGEGSFFVSQMKEAKTEKLLTGLNAQGAEELIDTQVQQKDAAGNMVQGSAMDYILDRRPDMIAAAKNDPRIYNNISGAVTTRIAEHARQRILDEYGAAIRTSSPGISYEELLARATAAARAANPSLVEAAEFDTPPPSGGGGTPSGGGGPTGGGGGGTPSGGGTGGGTGGGGGGAPFKPSPGSSSTGGVVSGDPGDLG